MLAEAERRTEFEQILAELEGLTTAQIGERIAAYVAPEDATSFSIAMQSLSLAAVRFMAARVLFHHRRAARRRSGT